MTSITQNHSSNEFGVFYCIPQSKKDKRPSQTYSHRNIEEIEYFKRTR